MKAAAMAPMQPGEQVDPQRALEHESHKPAHGMAGVGEELNTIETTRTRKAPTLNRDEPDLPEHVQQGGGNTVFSTPITNIPGFVPGPDDQQCGEVDRGCVTQLGKKSG